MTKLRLWRQVGALVLLPALLGLVTWLVIRGFADELPDQVATHWGNGSAPNGFSSRATGILFPSVFGPLIGIVMGGALWFAFRKAPQMRRSAGAMAGFLSGMVGGIGVASLWIQRGLTDAHDAHDSGAFIGVGLVAGVIGAIVGGLLMPGEVPGAARATSAVPADAPRMAVPLEQQVAWTGWARSPALLYASLAAVALTFGVLAASGMSSLATLPVVVLVALLLVSMSTFRVTIGRNGLTVRSVAGWPRFHVPLDEVAEAQVVHVQPLKDFGGWGIRGDRTGRFGVVLRGGEALEVRRGDESRFVVTVDNAGEAAALLNTLADRARVRL